MTAKSKIDWGYEFDKWIKIVLISLCLSGAAVYAIKAFHLVPQ